MRRLCFPNLSTNQCAVWSLQTKFIHLKVYDKDVDLDAQREANKHKKAEGNPFAKVSESPSRISHRGGRIDSRPVVSDSETEEKKFQNIVERDEEAVENDSDTFGNARISETQDAGDLIEEEYQKNPPRRLKKLHTVEYARMIKEHLNANRLRDAIAVLEQRMLKEDKATPENYIYNLLISGCAKMGYTRKAFSLFTRMRQRGLKVTGGTYTSLFNACANAPSNVDGLQRATELRTVMLEKGVEMNVKNYNAMIKCYGRWGDLKTAFLLADEMMERNLDVNAETFNFLLQACASDHDYGFRHCLLTWHKMVQRGIRPDYYTFNAVLRCVRDTSFGDIETMKKVLQQILNERSGVLTMNNIASGRNVLGPSKQLDSSAADKVNTETNNHEEQSMVPAMHVINDESTALDVPNLLAQRPHLGNLISLTEVTRPHERFLLLGGLTGYLELMKQHHVTPDIETFTTMLEVLPPTNAAEKQMLTFIRKIGLKADIDFFNVLIKKRAMRFDYEGGKEVFSMIRTAGLTPDIVTYGVLALGCTTSDSARELLQQMSNNSVRMNIQILGAMLRQGCANKEFGYVNEIMQISLDEHIKPNDIFLSHLHSFYNRCARAIDARHPWTKTKAYRKSHGKFCDKLRLYQEEHGIAGLKLEDAIRKIKERPYEHYKEDPVVGIEPSKNEKLARKQKIRKYIKKIKIENLRGDDINDSNRSKTKAIE